MQATKDLIKAYYDAFNKEDWVAFLDCLSDDVIHDINQNGTQKGKDAFRAFMEHMGLCYHEKVIDLIIMATVDGNYASALFMVEGTYIKTDKGLPEAKGQHYLVAVGAFFSISDGKISRVTNYYNLEEWKRQVSK